MAKNVKNKKKKRSNYDDKLVKIITVSLAATLVVIVAVALIISYMGSYVAKVDGERIMKHEYKYFLQNTMFEMKNEAIEAGDLAKDAKADDIAKFWTAERKKKAEEKALEEAKKWKAQYILAEDAGFDLDYEERYNYKMNLENQLYQSYQQYQSYYSFAEFAEMYLGMDLADYEDIAIQTAAIEAYKDDMKKSYSATDTELRAWYDKEVDDYRKVTLSVLALEKPDKPTEVKKPEKKENMTKEEEAAYQIAENEYKEYQKKLEEYNTENEELKGRVEDIKNQLNTTGKYNEPKKSEGDAEKNDSEDSATTDKNESTSTTTPTSTATATPESTTSATATATPGSTAGVVGPTVTTTPGGESATTENADGDAEKVVYTDATLADIAAKEGALFSDSNGEVVINALSKSGQDKLDDIALSMQWRKDSKVIVRLNEDGTEDEAYLNGETVEGVTYTQYVTVEDDDYYYVLRCIGIEDFDNSKESSEGAKDSVKDTVRKDIYEDKAEKALEKMIADAGDKYKIKSVKKSAIEDILKDFVWS